MTAVECHLGAQQPPWQAEEGISVPSGTVQVANHWEGGSVVGDRFLTEYWTAQESGSAHLVIPSALLQDV